MKPLLLIPIVWLLSISHVVSEAPPMDISSSVELAVTERIAAPAIGRRDQPVKINHPKGAKAQAIYVDGRGEWAFLPEEHFIRHDTFTILAAPPATYLLTTGDSSILKIVGDADPEPRPKPDPKPEPEPQPDPEPGPAPILADWAVWIEEQSERANHVEETMVMTSAENLSNLRDRGLKVRIYDDDQPEAKWLVQKAGDVRPAFLLLEDKGDPRVFPAPKSAEELEKIIRENVVR